MPTRLVILAPSALYREAWRALLTPQPDIVVVGAISHAESLAGFPPASSPTTLLVDWPQPTPDFARQLRTAAPEYGLLFFVPTYHVVEIVPLLQAGATGCISRDDTVGDLSRAIIAAGRGELVLPPTMAAQALLALARGQALNQNPTEALSEREMEIVRLLAHGQTNKDIAQTLILSVRTVEAHLRSIFAKLGVRSRTEAALWAVKQGYGERNNEPKN
ncbi:MAG: response regulator transcription factor [Anaerolineales bacterium]